jgi:hypothetical protein
MSRVGAHFRRRATPHTDWCARDHRCGVNEHRSPGVVADRLGGRAVITRVRAEYVEYVEVHARIPLHGTETGARWQVAATLRLMRDLLAAVAIRPGVLRSPARRPAVEGRPVRRVQEVRR